MPPVMFSVVTKYHKGRHSLFLYNSEIFYAFTQDILRSHQLSNGHYITGNRKLVISGQYKQPKQVIVKHRINRYQTANLTKRNGSYKRGQRMTIKHYTFSHATNKQKRGTMRFAVKGGYITANQKFVRVNR